MNRKLIVMMFTLCFLSLVSIEMQAQNDGYFTALEDEYRSADAMGLSFYSFSGHIDNGFNFDSFISGNDGFSFEEFTGDEVPVSSGLFLMTATGLVYIINKRRKENER